MIIESFLFLQRHSAIDGEPHRHDPNCIELNYIIEGACTFINGEVTCRAQTGDICIFSAANRHKLTAVRSRRGVRYYTILVRCGKNERELFRMLSAVRSSKLHVGKGLLRYFESIRSNYEAHTNVRRESARYTLLGFLYELSSKEMRPSVDHRLERALDAIQRAVGKPTINVPSIAKLVGMSRSHFIRTFSRQLTCSPVQYFLRLKIDSARMYLQNPEESIGDIADALGFTDQFHFSRLFKRYTGVSPSAYRTQASPKHQALH